METFRIWGVGCTHSGKDTLLHNHKSLHRACRDAENFGMDIGASLGDFSGEQGLPTNQEGRLYREQLLSGLKNHFPEHIYPLQGNHDRTDKPGDQCGEWFNRWMDPLGIHDTRNYLRPFPIVDGTWDAYEVRVGNLSLLFMSDVNRLLTPLRGVNGGDPGGVVTARAYQWWKDKCASYRGTNITVVTFSHYMPFETTTATKEYGGGKLKSNGEYVGTYHGPGKENGRTSSFLAYVEEDSSTPFVDHLEQHPGDCDLWVGAHNHVISGKAVGGLEHIVSKYGCLFVQNGAVTKYHHGPRGLANPKSRFYEFTEGSNKLLIHAYIHETMNGFSKGLLSTKEFNLTKTFNF